MGIVAACRALCGSDEDTDHTDSECDVDRATAKLDAEAAKIERRAERLKHKAENLEKLHARLREHVSELEALGWF